MERWPLNPCRRSTAAFAERRGHLSLRRLAKLSLSAACLLSPSLLPAQVSKSANDLVAKMLVQEDYEANHRGHYMYLSNERSDRTNGHLWTEKVVETSSGKLRMLIAEDGQPLNGDRLAAEKARLAQVEAHPDAFERQEQALKNDEQHAKEMLNLLSKAFLFENERREGDYVRIDFKPDPNYAPQSMEERVMHGMSGSMLVDPRVARLHMLEGRLPQDVSIGFGLLATVHAGSNFSTKRDSVAGNEWKTVAIDTNIEGKALFFRSIGKKEHAEHADFKPVAMDLTLPQALEMLEK